MSPATAVESRARPDAAAGGGAPAARTAGDEPALRRGAIAARIASLLPASAFAIAGVVLAGYQPAAAAVETLHLTLVGGCALAGAALLAGAGARMQTAGPLLAALALWALPPGPPRGIACGIVFVAAFVVAAWRRLRLGELDTSAAVGGALALHALLRQGELLPAVLATAGAPAILRLLVPPVLAGLAVAWLARRHPLGAVLAAGAAVAVTAQGFTATGALPLLALAALDAVRAWRQGSTGNASFAAHGAGARGAAALGASRIDRDGLAALGFALAVAALGAARPAAGALAIAAASLSMLPRAWVWAVAAAPLAYGLVTGADPQRLFALAALVALLPFGFLPGAAHGGRRLGAVLVGAGGALLLPPPAGLAAAVTALALASESAGARGSLQRGWLGTLLALSALAAGYPWLRAQPLDVALGALGLPAVSAGRGALLTAALLLAAAMVLLAIAARVSSRLAAGLLAVGVAAAVLAAMPPAGRKVTPAGVDGVALRANAPEWTVALDGPPVARVRVVSTLTEAAALPAGAAVATLSLEREGRPLAAWTLRAGKDTAEWAADRPDPRGVAVAGPVWWSWLPPPGTFYAHTYASTWQLSRPVPATTIRIVRDPALEPAVTLSLLGVEVNR